MASVRQIDTSTLGPIRIEPLRIARARTILAAKVEEQGPAWRNAADSIRAGFSNIWIAPALAAIEEVLRRVPADDDE